MNELEYLLDLSQEEKIRFSKYNQNFESLYFLFKNNNSNEELKNTILNNKHFTKIYNSKIKNMDLVNSCTNEDELYEFISIDDVDVKNEIYKHPLCPIDLKMIVFCQIKSSKEQIAFLNFASYSNIKLIAANTTFKDVLQFIIDNTNENRFDESIKDIAKNNRFFNVSSSLIKDDESIDKKQTISIESNILDFIKSSQKSKEDNKIEEVKKVNIEEELPVLNKIELSNEFISMLEEQKSNTLVELPFGNISKPFEYTEENQNEETFIESTIVESIKEETKENIVKPIFIEEKKEEINNVDKLRLTTNISDLIFNSSTKILDEKLAIVNNPICPLNILEKFSIDPNLMVKSGIAWNPNVSINILNDFLEIDDIGFLLTLISSPQLPKPLIRKLSNKENPLIKELVNSKLNLGSF